MNIVCTFAQACEMPISPTVRIQAACRTRHAECLSVPRCAYKQLVEQMPFSPVVGEATPRARNKAARQGGRDDRKTPLTCYLHEERKKNQANYFAFVKPTSSGLLCVGQANVKQTTLRSSSKRQANYFAFVKQTSSELLCDHQANIKQPSSLSITL